MVMECSTNNNNNKKSLQIYNVTLTPEAQGT